MHLKKSFAGLLTFLMIVMPFYSSRLQAKETQLEKTIVEFVVNEKDSGIFKSPFEDYRDKFVFPVQDFDTASYNFFEGGLNKRLYENDALGRVDSILKTYDERLFPNLEEEVLKWNKKKAGLIFDDSVDSFLDTLYLTPAGIFYTKVSEKAKKYLKWGISFTEGINDKVSFFSPFNPKKFGGGWKDFEISVSGFAYRDSSKWNFVPMLDTEFGNKTMKVLYDPNWKGNTKFGLVFEDKDLFNLSNSSFKFSLNNIKGNKPEESFSFVYFHRF